MSQLLRYTYDRTLSTRNSLIRSGAAIPFTAHATPPTVTMPRVKALTTGSVPSFLDLILNFAESDTTSTLASQDTWLAQLRARGGRLVFYGDDTWLKLFPAAFFARADGTSSFFVSVSRHLALVLFDRSLEEVCKLSIEFFRRCRISQRSTTTSPVTFPVSSRVMTGVL